jgi:predicted patatin/cPLA2 family phospholipase
MDYAIKAYFGWLGGSVAWASKYAVMPFKEGAYPDENWVNTASIGFIRTLPANQSRYVTSFYDFNKKISQAYADMRHYAEIGDASKVQQMIEEKGDAIQMAKFYEKTSQNMANIRKQIRVVTADSDLSGEEKRQEIDRLKQLISELAKQAEEVRKSMKK